MSIGIGGPIENLGIDGRGFSVAADAGVNRDLGGFTNTVEINGDGTARQIKERRPFLIEGLTVDVDDAAGDQEFLQGVADKKGFVSIDITFANGATYSGEGTITDAIVYDSQKSLAEIKLSGTGMTKQ
jgi:hypothetical protein